MHIFNEKYIVFIPKPIIFFSSCVILLYSKIYEVLWKKKIGIKNINVYFLFSTQLTKLHKYINRLVI